MISLKNITDFTNIKLTTARKSILEILVSSNKPLSYDEIKDKISMDKATFYRNISIFEEDGIVESFESNDKKRYFEIKKSPHSHFICTDCSNIECIHESLDLNLKNYIVENIILKGKCKKCNKSKLD